MQKQKLVLIGNGMAGIRCIENILKISPSKYDITVFGSEPYVNYSRIKLSSVLQGETSFDDITLHHLDWYNKHEITLHTGETVIEIDKTNKSIHTDKGRAVTYDKLILATGSEPILLPIPGSDLEGVITFRTIADCQVMKQTAKQYKKAVVIGGGLLGLEAARGLINLGMKVIVVHLADTLMNRQLDDTAAGMLKRELEQQGMEFLLEKETSHMTGGNRVERVHFKDGTSRDADLVVMAVGIKPNVMLAKKANIATNRGILVDDYLETSEPDIFAVGECVEHNQIVYGLVKPLYEQGEVLAQHLCNIPTKGYQGSVLSTHLKVAGINVFSVGQFTEHPTIKSIQFHNEIVSTYKKVFFQDNKAIGAVLYGDIKEGPKLLDTIVKQKFIPDKEKADLLKPVDIRDSYTANLPRSEFICTCNSVSKGQIIDCVLGEKLTTIKEVQACTKASSSCGGCKPAVSELLEYISSDYFNEASTTSSFCSCTLLTEDDVVAQIQARGLSSKQEIMKELNWKVENGCNTCHPALDYYLAMIYPEYDHDQDMIYLTDKRNAILRNDGTYSVVPQLYGGTITTAQLSKITAVTDKYNLAPLEITSDQRIHLNNIKQEDLPAIWTELDMNLHSVTANTIKIINTSNGNDLCNCDKQPANELTARLDKETEFVKVPYQIRIGVSTCMHHRDRSITKDVGLIKIDRGWEIYVGGSSGRNQRAAELLTVADTKEDAVHFTLGFIQYYRESANYSARSWHWIDRVSIVHIREILFNEDHLHFLVNSLANDVKNRKKILVQHF
ncbi:nitrite reductase large subunit NirB [Aquibacillus salsiterrae]|uniref:Nitrite reductase large subunit NirB n=1 Tax=Aquibacillus salsiterrae TaxID=2950439 RepID=A0A9X3WG83_9BACI|nr:nitrite reductase large subunit NirB [Aquibacillus salsiterrae]MDC3418438.1 nitrite reductase large subunit NirB [Aquibacillus salsiterrae]